MASDLVSELSGSEIELCFESHLNHSGSGETCENQSGEFMKLFGAHRVSIEVYLRMLLPTAADVDDVFQETSLVLWREFQGFTSGTNFRAWACAIALNRVRAWRSRQGRESRKFGALTLEVSDELISDTEPYDARLAVLSECMDRLKPHHRELLRRRYELGESVELIAQSSHQSVDAVYKMLSRIRQDLFERVTCQTR